MVTPGPAIAALVCALAVFGGVCVYALTKEIWEY